MQRRSRAHLALVVSETHRDVGNAELAQGLLAGHGWAMTEAWRRFAPMVLVMAERALGSRSEADDLVQEVFIRVFRCVSTLLEPNSLRSFVYSVAVRTLKSHLRYRRLRSWLTFRQPETLVDLRSVAVDVESRQLLRRFYALLDRLAPRDRLVFTLRRVEGMTVEEIAETMGLSVSTVKRSFARASSRLSRWVDAEPGLVALVDGKLGARGA
jgi:RNA polymerase sigma-70 factor (ECF subfamily)